MAEITLGVIIIIIILFGRFDKKMARDLSYAQGFKRGYIEAKKKLLPNEEFGDD